MSEQNYIFHSLHPERDCKAYLLADPASGEAAIVDPRFDYTRRYLGELETRGLTLKYAIDTHTHADHLSGADRLRNITGCKVAMGDKTGSKVADLKLADGEKLALGQLELTALHTPGHTPDSICIVAPGRVMTGDTLFIGTAARTDFMGGSSAQLFDSFRRIEALGLETEVWPGHDYNGKQSSTIAAEAGSNPPFMDKTRDELVARLAMKGPLPANMAEMLAFNSEAGTPEDKIIHPKDVARLGVPGRDYTCLDVRYDDEFAAGRIEGAKQIVLTELKERLGELEGLPRPILSVCKAGVRATVAMMMARRAGMSDWLLLEGGMEEWSAGGLPMVADDGVEPAVIVSKLAVGGSCAAGGGSCAAG